MSKPKTYAEADKRIAELEVENTRIKALLAATVFASKNLKAENKAQATIIRDQGGWLAEAGKENEKLQKAKTDDIAVIREAISDRDSYAVSLEGETAKVPRGSLIPALFKGEPYPARKMRGHLRKMKTLTKAANAIRKELLH
jgi:hypothetical protein